MCGLFKGNTSTDVEKTQWHVLGHRQYWKHLHGRGEDCWPNSTRAGAAETPPRTWRRPFDKSRQLPGYGNTSTDVEKTSSSSVKREP